MCYRRRYGKKKGGDTKHNTQKQPTNPPQKKKTCARSFSTGEENTVGQKERYVLRITHAMHFCYASTGPLLLLFEPCRRPTTKTNQGMTHPTPPTTHRKHTLAHTRQPHRARPPPHATHTNTKGHTAHTHTPRPRRRAPGRHTHRTTTPHHQKHRHHKHATHYTARPPRTPTHTTNTHNKGHPRLRNTPPQPAGPSQEWRGAAHHHRQPNPARSGGE